MEEALKESKDGVLIDVTVSPNAKRTEVVGYNQWRKAIEVRVKSPPKGGKANTELIEFFRQIFRCDVVIVKGQTSTQKTLLIKDLSKDEVLEILRRNVSKQS